MLSEGAAVDGVAQCKQGDGWMHCVGREPTRLDDLLLEFAYEACCNREMSSTLLLIRTLAAGNGVYRQV